MNWIKDIQVIIFDLDGTLYQDHSFMYRYLNYMVDGGPHEPYKADILQDLSNILQGQHSCKIGNFYYVPNKLCFHHDNEKVTAAYTWQGEQSQDWDYTNTELLASMEDVIYVGDSWSVLHVLAQFYGISKEKRQEAFMAVRRDMIGESHAIQKHEQVIRLVRELGTKYRKILMTNSQKEAAEGFVSFLGLENAFDEITFGGEKPYGLEGRIKQLVQEENIAPHQIVSIGDHAWNDLYPVRRSGGRTVFISPYRSYDTNKWDLQLTSMDELAQFIESLQQRTTEGMTVDIITK